MDIYPPGSSIGIPQGAPCSKIFINYFLLKIHHGTHAPLEIPQPPCTLTIEDPTLWDEDPAFGMKIPYVGGYSRLSVS
jgi:hypothetical protein